jgi:hypothetical protein
VTPDAATKTERHAAEELAGYLERISGANVPVVKEGATYEGLRIDVGATDRAKENLPESSAAQKEAIFIKTVPGGLMICGGSDRGTLMGVYRFLEEYLGCRWLAPGIEHIPKRKIIELEAIDYASRPAFDMRFFKAPDEPEARSWGIKLGWNGLYTPGAAKENGNCYYTPAGLHSTHTWHQVIPHSQYFDKHPEWFPMVNGERVHGGLHSGQLCVTAHGLADEFAHRIIAIFDSDPDCQITSISPNDGYGWCECEACEALDDKLCDGRLTQQGLSKARPFRGDRVFWFSNRVAERVAEKCPDKHLLVLAYVNYAEPPDTVRPLPNVVPWLCHYAPADYSRPIADPSSEPNAQFNALLTEWADVCPHLLFYGYVSKSMWWELPRPVLRPFSADVKYLHSLGFHRYYAQSSLSNWPLDGPLYYVLGKLLWDPAQDPDALARDWTTYMFGEAAPDMNAYYEAVDASVRRTQQAYSDNPLRDVPGLYYLPDLERAKEALERALRSADTEVARERVERVCATFLYGYHMIQAIDGLVSAKAGSSDGAIERAVAAGREALKYRKVRKAAEFVESLATPGGLGVAVARGFGEQEERGGRTCWNSDETGMGDGRAGWASFLIGVEDPERPAELHMEVWGESRLGSVVIHDGKGNWTSIPPVQRLSGEAKWETMIYRIPPELMVKENALQEIGFGGGDSQVWIAHIEVEQQGPSE